MIIFGTLLLIVS